MASKLNEDLMNTNLDVPEGEIKLDGMVDPVYADAINVHEKKKEQVEDALKEQNKLAAEFIKKNDERETKKVTSPALKKMELEESLFEDCKKDTPVVEAFDYDEPTNMGKGYTAPTVADYTDDIQMSLKHVEDADENARRLALKHLAFDVKRLIDNKENVERYNSYWAERYPAAIDFIDKQLELISPTILREIFHMDELDEAVAVAERPANKSKRFRNQEFSTDYIYRAKRDPLADIIQDELTRGETVYRMGDDGKIRPTWAPSLNLNYEDTGASSDENGDYIIAWVADEGLVKQVEAIGHKYGKEVKTGYDKNVGATPYWVKIYINDEDWDEPYFDPNVKTIKDVKR